MGKGCVPLISATAVSAQTIHVLLIIAAEQRQGCDEEAASSDGHEDDGVAIGSTGRWRSSSGVVTALGTVLGEGWRCA